MRVYIRHVAVMIKVGNKGQGEPMIIEVHTVSIHEA